MNRLKIKSLVEEYLSLVKSDASVTNEVQLVRLLDQLAVAVGGAEYEFDSADRPDPPRDAYEVWRSRVARSFPELGPYNIASSISVEVGEAVLNVCDAVDDIADIAIDLDDVLRRWRDSADDALWHFVHNFNAHWGEHLRALQLYLHARRDGC